MTIGPTPRHPGLIHALTGGPPAASVSARDGAGGGHDGFAQALRTAVGGDPRGQRFGGTAVRESAERFNENGFFADAGALAAPAFAAPYGDDDLSAAEGQAPAVAKILPEAAFDPVETFVPAAPITPTAGAVAALRTTPANAAATIAASRPVAESEPMAACSAPFSTGAIAATVEPEAPAPTPRLARPLPPSTAGAKSPVSVALDAGDGAAAVTISARGLNDHEIHALRTDIAALLRRHGLTLDDLKLNGRPTGQGKHDRSGG
jgi:hypothetical protein